MTMTGKQRVLAAVEHRTTDRIPVTFDAEPEVYKELFDALHLQDKAALFDHLGVDTWMLLPENFVYPNAEMQKTEKISIWGYKTTVAHYPGGSYDELTYSPLSGKDDLQDIAEHAWPGDDLLNFSHFPGEAKQHENRAVIGAFAWGSFFIAAYVRGMEDLLIDFAMRKDYAHALIDRISERVLHYLQKMLETAGEGLDIVYMADDYCSQRAPLFSPDNFKEFVMPYLTQVVDLVHRHNKKFLLHCCGAVRPLLPQVIEAGVDMLEPLQIRAEGMDPAELKQEFGKDLCFYGGVDLQQILCRGTTDTVREEVKRLIDILGPDGGYIIGPGHTYIQMDAPIANITAMYEQAKSYYPFGKS